MHGQESAEPASAAAGCRRLEGRVALVSGASAGIGRAIARRLAGEGASVVCGDLRPSPRPGGLDGEQSTEALIAGCGGRAAYIEWDIADAVQTERAIQLARAQFGRLDIVVASAGIALPEAGVLPDEDVELWRRHVDVNLTGTWHTIRLGLRALMDQGEGGRIVAVSSFVGLLAIPGVQSSYTATKTGVIGIVRQAAAEGARHGVTVNAVCPGLVRTSLSSGAWNDPDIHAQARAAYPLGRLGEAADIAAGVAFLASPDASWITGIALPIDGGRSSISAEG